MINWQQQKAVKTNQLPLLNQNIVLQPESEQNKNENSQEDDCIDVMQSTQQFSTFQKQKPAQPQINRTLVKYKSTFLDSDDDDDDDDDNNKKNQQTQKQSPKVQEIQQQGKQEISSQNQSLVQNTQPTEAKQDHIQTQIPNNQQNKDLKPEPQNQHSEEQTQNNHFCQDINVDELVLQSQILISKQRAEYQKDKQSSLKNLNAFVTQISSSDDENNENNQEELADKVPDDINSTGQILSDEMNSSNRILMSVMQQSFSKSIQKQHKLQQSLKSSTKSITNSVFKSKIVFVNNSPVVVGEDQYYHDNVKKIIAIQNYYKLVRPLRKDFKEKQKRNRYRAHVIHELITTEQKYVEDLGLVQEQIQKPLLKDNLDIEENDIRIMFNIDSIYYFNREFLKELQAKLKEGIIYYYIVLSKKRRIQKGEKNMKRTSRQLGLTKEEEQLIQQKIDLIEFKQQPNFQMMDKIIVLLPGFKFYYEYCKGYNQAQKLIETYKNNNKEFQQFITKPELKKKLKGLDVESYLIKPVQRLPKYVLLFKDLLKHTNQDHPDHININKCLKLFEEINDKNNIEMKVYLDQLKIMELQTLYGKFITIAEPNRTLIFEDTCSIYTTEQKSDIILYAFNNLILFIQKKQNEQNKYRAHLSLTHTSYVKDKEDTNFYQFMFEIINKTESVLILNPSQEAKIQLMKKISSIIEVLKTKFNQMELFKKTTSMVRLDDCLQPKLVSHNIQVNIIGMESRNYQSKSYIVYITEVFIEEYQTKIFVRYSQIVQIQQIVNKFDPTLKVPVFSTMNWFQTIDQKVLEDRKLLIEKFLQLVLSSDKCQNDKEYQKQILDNLGLNPDFYNTPSRKSAKPQETPDDQEMMKMILQSQFNYGVRPNQLQLMMMNRQTTNILKAAKQQVNRTTITDFEDESSIIIGPESTKQPYFIDICLMDGSTVQVGFNKTTLTLLIKNKIAKHIKLKQWLDFRLFIVDVNLQQRVIDDDETMAVILDAHTQQTTGFKNAFKRIFGNTQKFQFIFRKYFYLSGRQEEADYLIDEVRQRYIFYELIWETRNEQFSFNQSDYELICALYSFAIDKVPDILILQKVIPKQLLKNVKERVWFENIKKCMNEILPQLKKQENENIQKQKKENKNYVTTKSGLARLMLLNYFKAKPLFGMTMYFVECNKAMVQLIQKEYKIKINSNIYLGLNHAGLHFLRPENKVIIFTSQYQQISEMRALTTEFCCKITDVKLSFNTQFSYEIKQLLTEYQQLSNFTTKLSSKIIK